MITKDMVINDVIKKYPKTITVFSNFKVDACCGGGFSIEKTVSASGIDLNALLTALNKVVMANK
ncbi:MAG: disulfide oxidoreductase [Candidatus Brocadia sp.]|nr:MAG: disulfide oxidoreductase [Candidatus Brocadia sp.]